MIIMTMSSLFPAHTLRCNSVNVTYIEFFPSCTGKSFALHHLPFTAPLTHILLHSYIHV